MAQAIQVETVLWGDAVYDATVITVHASNAVDVVYTINGSIGLSLAAEHNRQLKGEDGNPKEKPVVVKKVKCVRACCRSVRR